MLLHSLDQYGGHCGRADDYHYHIAPTHLTAGLGNDKPVAWALDGYLEVKFPRRIGAVDLLYSVQVSESLSAWPDAGTSYQIMNTMPNADGVTETITARVLPAIANTLRRFARLKITAQ